MLYFYPLKERIESARCHICGDNRDIDFYTIDDTGEERLVCKSCVDIINRHQNDQYGLNIYNDPLKNYGIARVMRIYKTKSGITIGEFGFNGSIYIRVNITAYEYWFIPDHINAYTLIYDERLKDGMIDTDEIVKGNPTVIIYGDDITRPNAVVVYNNYKYNVIEYTKAEERKEYFYPIFKDRDVKDIFFVDKRKKCEFDEWI